MYGLVNKAIKDLVVTNHGEEIWKEICRLSNFEDEEFVGMNPYPDKLTYDLVKNASHVLKADSAAILEAFGEYWILYTANEGYGDLMDISGSSFVEFLNNMDMLHYRISNIMPELAPPQFTTRNEKENSIELEYCNYLIITTAPSETIDQYESVFKKYIQFNNFNIIRFPYNYILHPDRFKNDMEMNNIQIIKKISL